MSDDTYKVILRGTVREGYDRREVVAALSRTFKQDPKVAERLLSGTARVVKKGLDLSTARKYEETLRRLGADTLIESEPPRDREAPMDAPATPSQEIRRTASRVTCPRCGYEPKTEADVLLVRGDCPTCGLIVTRPEGVEQPDESFIRRASAVERRIPDDYADVEFAPLTTRALASLYTFGLFTVAYICTVIGFMLFFFPLPNVPYQIAKNFLVTAHNNFPMLWAAVSILVTAFLLPLFSEGKTPGQREFGIGILFSGEAETGGLLLALAFRTTAMGLLTFSPGLLAIKVGKMLGYAESLEAYHNLIIVLMAVAAWTASWLFLLLSPNKRGVLDIAAGTIQIQDGIPPVNATVKALKPLGVSVGFLLVFGLLTPLLFK
ncbi:MAG: RDD family protein [Desulfomonilaceae bacterium]|nr:RDD family protein [Desulfomonilaceae bacterium]